MSSFQNEAAAAAARLIRTKEETSHLPGLLFPSWLGWLVGNRKRELPHFKTLRAADRAKSCCDAIGFQRSATSPDGRSEHPEVHRISGKAANQVGRAIGIRLHPQGAGAVHFQFQRLVVRRAEEIHAGRCAGVPPGPPEGAVQQSRTKVGGLNRVIGDGTAADRSEGQRRRVDAAVLAVCAPPA